MKVSGAELNSVIEELILIKWLKRSAGAVALSGLCMAVYANTTVSADTVSMQQVAAPGTAPNPPAGLVDPFSRTPMVIDSAPRQVRIAILLPIRSPSLGQVASAVL